MSQMRLIVHPARKHIAAAEGPPDLDARWEVTPFLVLCNPKSLTESHPIVKTSDSCSSRIFFINTPALVALQLVLQGLQEIVGSLSAAEFESN